MPPGKKRHVKESANFDKGELAGKLNLNKFHLD